MRRVDQGDAGLRQRLTEFVRYRREYLRGDEKGEAQIFSEALFRAFGHAGVRQAGATLDMLDAFGGLERYIATSRGRQREENHRVHLRRRGNPSRRLVDGVRV